MTFGYKPTHLLRTGQEAGEKEQGSMSANHAGRKGGKVGGCHGKRYIAISALSAIVLAVLLSMLGSAQGQHVHRNGFEVRNPAWLRGPADAAFKEAVHDITDQTAHTGQLSEHIQLTTEQGSFIHYHYPTAKAPLGEELAVRLWLKANRPGTQLMGRLVLPHERNPQNLNEPLTALLRGDQYQLVGRWQALELRRPIKLAREQQQLMRAELKRDLDFSDAYIDRLVLNVYSGPGLTEVWIDDLEIGPVIDTEANSQPKAVPTAKEREPATAPPASAPADAAHPIVEVTQDHLMVNNKRFFIHGIRHSDTPLAMLRDAGFNTIWPDDSVTQEQLDEANQLGLWVVPTLPPGSADPQWNATDSLHRAMSLFKQSNVLFYYLDGAKTSEEASVVRRTIQAVHANDPQRPIGADVWDGFGPYSRSLQLVGAHRWPLMTELELWQYRSWLNQRRLLADPGTFMWTWIQTHLPEWYTALVYDRPGHPGKQDGFTDPIGPQPEQIRLLTYLAISAGSQGLGYWSDRFLADSHQGRDRLLMLALLNQELQMLEPLLLNVVEQPSWIDTSNPSVKAAVMRTEKGVLVLPIWMGRGSQYVPGQAAAAQVSITVPQVPNGMQAWEISPGDVHALKMERVTGGSRITLPEFGLTSAIVFTSDNTPTGMLVRFQEHARRTRKQAATWMYDLAVIESEKVLKVEADLEHAGHVLPDGQALQEDAHKRLLAAKDLLDGGDYREGYFEAQRALRPLRILMRAQWEMATKQLDTPVASAYALSYFTLPKHWTFMGQVQHAKVGANVLPDGDFEATSERTPNAWLPQETTLDDVLLEAWRVAQDPHEGKRCLKLEIKPKHPENPPGALERTFLAINSPAVKLAPGTMVRISGWVRIPKAITASADGAMMYDNAGGEPMAVRLIAPTQWKKFTLYRKVPDSGSINVTLALTGIGVAYFDDIKIEPLNIGPTWSRPGTAAAVRQ
jgi:hypothetical protein